MDTSVAAKQPQWLEKPVRISEQKWPEGTQPVVSIFCITYNHEKFIRDAIEGFLMQETTFPVEIFVHDDASSDGTAEIVKEYADRSPKLFWTILQTENQWSKGNKNVFLDYLAQQRGEFIAFCEGDDYWTDRKKIQKQVSLLRSKKNLSLVGHSTRIVSENGTPTHEPEIPGATWPKKIDLLTYLKGGSFGLHLSSWIARSAALRETDWIRGLAIGDVPMMLQLASQGEVAFIAESMSCYRRHGGSYWAANPGAWQAKANIQVFQAASRQFHGEARRLAGAAVCKHRFGLAETLYAEGKISQALWLLVRFCLERSILGSVDGVPSLETGARRFKQMLMQRPGNSPRKA